MNELHARLKAETTELHKATEAVPRFSRVMKSDYSKAEYQDLLSRFYDFFYHYEEALDRVPSLHEYLPDLPQRKRASSLSMDLTDLGGVRPQSKSIAVPQPQNLSEAFGVMYVLEGSTLGGQMIQRKLRSLDFISDRNLNFYNHSGENTGANWRKFLAALELARMQGRLNDDQVVAAANQTFHSLIDRFQE